MATDEWLHFEWWWEKSGIWLGRSIVWSAERIGVKLPTGRPIDIMRNATWKRRELTELRRLHAKLDGYASRTEEIRNALRDRAVNRAFRERQVPASVMEAAHHLAHQLLDFEEFFVIPEIDFNRELPTSEIWTLTKSLRRQIGLFENQDHQQYIEDSLAQYLVNIVDGQLPPTTQNDGLQKIPLNVPLHNVLRDPKEAIEELVRTTFRIPEDNGLFTKLVTALDRNICIASGIDPNHNPDTTTKPVVMPTMSKLTSPPELVQTYLAQTPFPDFFNTSFPFALPLKARFEHTHIVAGSGHGKTQLLQNLILEDLPYVKDGKRSVVVIDSQGDLIRNILKLASVGEMAERVVLIDPNDMEHPPALNLFDFGLHRLDRYDRREREVILNGAIELYEYLFGALLGAELSQRQGVVFRYIARLMMHVPKATILTLLDFMEQPERTRPHLKNLDETTARFFETHFFANDFNPTRRQILTRLYDVLSESTLNRMFTNERNKLNLFEAMNSGHIILINTAKELLKQNGSEILGRFFIALICQAAQERAPIDEDKRQDTFVYIDEAHDYFDESIENLLNQARKYRVGLVLAHQNLNQFHPRLYATVKSSTSIKLVGGLSDDDASDFARQMSSDVRFLKSIRKHDTFTEFACSVRNYTPSAIRLNVPFGQLDVQPKMSQATYNALIERNRKQYCTPRGPDGEPPPTRGLEDPELL